MIHPTIRIGLALVAGLFVFSACASAPRAPAPRAGLPPIPEVGGPLDLRVVHPTPDTPLPRVDSTFVYGSVGTGEATLAINGTPVPVRPNGAFLAFLPIPADGVFRLEASSGGRSAALERAYRPAAAPAAAPATAPPSTEALEPALSGVVTGGAETLATGSDVAVARPTPTGTYRWFLPRGARVTVTGRRGEMLRLALDTATAWIPASEVTLGPPAVAAAPAPLASPAITPAAGWLDVRFPADGAPFRVEAGRDTIAVTLYGRAAPASGTPPADPLLRSLSWSQDAGSARATLALAGRVWGYKAFYTPAGELVLRLRRPPNLSPMDPLRGARIVVDPGHPPGGATGPTGLTEAEANLAIGLRLAERLRARGAEVILTRTDGSAVGLQARVDLAVDRDAHLLVSVHNNAFAEGVNPFLHAGTSTYYFHPFSVDLARALDREIAEVTRVRDLGARVSNLALVRPTWMPTTLTESLFMLVPEHEAALRDPEFLDRLAEAHVRGIESFLRKQF